ncbi:unnamed protein product, partial [Closterium sp. Naga37s-1]
EAPVADLDDSDSSGEEDAAVDDADNVPEAVFRDTDNFNTLMEVFRFIVGCNNGRGLSNESTVWLLNLLRDERLNLVLVRHWRTFHAMMQYGLSLLMEHQEYETYVVTVPGCPIAFEVSATSGKEAVLKLLSNPANADGFVILPREESSGAGRMYTTPETAICWEEAHKAAGETFGPGTIVVPLIISSDATFLSGNERTKVWAVYISIANIPLHRRWTESGKILLAMLSFPPSRMSPSDKVALFQAAMKIVLADLIVALHSRTVWGNTYLTLAVDIMRAIYIDFWVYIRDCLRGNNDCERVTCLAIVAILEWHESCIRASFQTDTSLTELEGRTKRYWGCEVVFPRGGQGWNLLKVHLLTHLPAAIRRWGLPQEFLAAVYENAHIRTCKLPYRSSNHRAPTRAIAQHNTRAGMVAQLGTRLIGGRRNNTAMARATRTGTPQLTRSCRSLTERPTANGEADSVFDLFNTALGGVLGPYSVLMRGAGLCQFPAKAHTALALPSRQTDVGTLRADYVRAAVSMHGHQAFSCVEYDST